MTNKKSNIRKCVIQGIPPFKRTDGVQCEFIAALSTLLRFYGKEVSLPYLLAMSGMAFRFVHNPARKGSCRWSPGSYNIMEITQNPREALVAAFEAAGYDFTLVERGRGEISARNLRELIDKGEPVIILGGPDSADFSLITGYEEEGEVLLGSSLLGNDYRWENWYDSGENGVPDFRGYLLLGMEKEIPSAPALYLAAIRKAVYFTRLASVNDLANGLEGLAVLARELRQKKFFPRKDRDTLWINYLVVQCDLMLLGHRRLAACFLEDAASFLPGSALELAAAGDKYREVGELLERLEELVPGDFCDASLSRLTDDGTREKFADILLDIRSCEQQAVEKLEQVLCMSISGT